MLDKPHSRCDHVMLHYAVIAGIIQFGLHLVQIPNFAIGKSPSPYNSAFSMICSWCDTGDYSPFTNSSPYIGPPIWPKDFKLWLVSPKDLIPLLNCPALVCFGSLELFDIVLLYQQWFLDSKSAIWASFPESSPHSRYWHIFSRHCFSCAVMFGAISLLSRRLVILMKLTSALVKQEVSSK